MDPNENQGSNAHLSDEQSSVRLRARAQQLTLELYPYPVANYQEVIDGMHKLSQLRSSTIPKVDAINDLHSDCAWMLTCQQLSDIQNMESELQDAMSRCFDVHHRLIRMIHDLLNSSPECQPSKRSRLLGEIRSDIERVAECNVLFQLPEAGAVRSKVSDLANAQRELRIVHQQLSTISESHS